MYKMRMRISVDVDITAEDAHEAFARLNHVKHSLRWALSTNSVMKDQREMVSKFAIIQEANTNAMLCEETINEVK